MMQVFAVPAFADNYIWLVHDPASGETAVVDPGDPVPVLAELDRRGWRLTTIVNTHWHPDHTGGNLAVKEATGAAIVGPAAEAGRIPGLDRALAEGDRIRIGTTILLVEAIATENPDQRAVLRAELAVEAAERRHHLRAVESRVIEEHPGAVVARLDEKRQRGTRKRMRRPPPASED